MFKFFSENNRVGAKINRVIPVLALILTGLFFLYNLLEGMLWNRQASTPEEANATTVANATDLLLLHQRARDFLLSSRFADAEMLLGRILQLDSASFVAYNNLGNAGLLQGRLDLAKENYFKALSVAETMDESLGVHFNLAALLFTAGAASLAEEVRAYAGALTAVSNLRGSDLRPHDLYFPEPMAVVAENVEPTDLFAANDRSNSNDKNGSKSKGSNPNKGSGSQKDKGKGKKDNTSKGGQKAQADPRRNWLGSYQWDMGNIESSRKPAAQSPGTTVRSVPPLAPTEAANRPAGSSVPAVDAERFEQPPGSRIVVPPIMVVTDIANQLARYHGFTGDYAEAQKYLRKVIALDANNFTAHNNLGNLYFLQGQLDSAMTAYSKALPLARTADDSLGIRLNLGALWHAVNADTLAAAQIAEVLHNQRDLSRVERLLGLKFDDIDLAEARAEQLRGVTVFSMKQLVLMASRFSGSRPAIQSPGGAKPPVVLTGKRVAGEIENVFAWAR
ncbi:MAG: hypothetical protein ALAOOOJD_00089 [bacterium]|nr:hypothetical protein [bacterium]